MGPRLSSPQGLPGAAGVPGLLGLHVHLAIRWHLCCQPIDMLLSVSQANKLSVTVISTTIPI